MSSINHNSRIIDWWRWNHQQILCDYVTISTLGDAVDFGDLNTIASGFNWIGLL